MRSLTKRLIAQSQDAALTAVQVFNNPLLRFKSENFIVLINIAWTYLLHAHYRDQDVEYRYCKGIGQGRRYERRPNGAFRYWDLRKCLTASECPLDRDTKKNLDFLIGLRDEITHHMSPQLDQFVSARYQACCLNYNHWIKELFGTKFGIDQHLSYSLQFSSLSREQLSAPSPDTLPKSVRSYIAQFDSSLTPDELNSTRFAYRMFFMPKLVGKPGQADEVIEFVRPDTPLGRNIARKQVAVREVERPKHRAKPIVTMMKAEGFQRFNMHHFTQLWKSLDGKNSGKGWGTMVSGTWYWYDSWIDVVRSHCQTNAPRYG